jgi:hypothetical protein
MVTTLSMRNGDLVWVDQDNNIVSVINGLDGEPEEIADRENEGSDERVWAAFKDTPEGAEFFEKYNTEVNRKRFGKIYETLFGDIRESCSRLQEAYRQAVSIGEFQAPPKPAPTAAPRPRTDDGRFADAHWAVYLRMINDPTVSAAEITRKLNSNRDFRLAVEESKRKESGAPAAKPSPLVAENKDEIEFARAYRRTASLKPVAGLVRMDFGDGVYKEFPYADFEALTNRAIELGIL